MYGDEPYLTVGNSILPMSTIIALEEHKAPTGTTNPPPEEETETSA